MPPANIVVTKKGPRESLAELVMAWARDSETGEPRYILELDKLHRGSKCGCECPSCGLPVTAVNAAKAEFLRRPHFRHPEGAVRDDCLVLTARAAILRELQEDGWIELPRRQLRGQTVGLSGKLHESWVEAPAERLRINNVSYRDRAFAVITFDDGRQLHVDLLGTSQPSDPTSPSGQLAPTIFIGVDDPELAAMPPDELRRRARLLPSELCWRSHWHDAELQAQADAKAQAEAHYWFDDTPQGLDLPEGLDPSLRRETVLHLEVKRILEKAGRLVVPKVVIAEKVPRPAGGEISGEYVIEEEELRLSGVVLETRYGRLIPDVTCEAFGDDGHARYLPLLIEVTVTNSIDEERLARIRLVGEATLEIDLNKSGGRINRDELRHLVVEELALKRWLFHPDEALQRKALLGRLAKQGAEEQAAIDAHHQWLKDRRAGISAMSRSDVAVEFLESATALYDAISNGAGIAAAREQLADSVDKMAIHGFPEAGNEGLVGSSGLLPGLLSIYLNRPVGSRHLHIDEVVKDLRRSVGPRRTTASIYLIALKAYPQVVSTELQPWVDDWAGEVRESIKAHQETYLRDPVYDRVLSVLFPEMAAGLAKKGGKLASGVELRWDPQRQEFIRPAVPERNRHRYLNHQPRTDLVNGRLLDTMPGDFWLRGRDLEAWKKANPESARVWFPDEAT